MALGNDSILREIRDHLKKMSKSLDDISRSVNKKDSVAQQPTWKSYVPIPVTLDWTNHPEDDPVGLARILDNGESFEIHILLTPGESAKAREVIKVAPLESLTITSIAAR